MNPRSRYAARLVAGGLVWLAGCRGGRPVLEQVSPTIAGSTFTVIATIAGQPGRTSLRMSATVRERLDEAGWTAVRRAGRWDNQAAAVTAICAGGDVDGVLFVWYNRLELQDCATGMPAYSIAGSPERGVGLDQMVDRLMRYLRQERTAPPPN